MSTTEIITVYVDADIADLIPGYLKARVVDADTLKTAIQNRDFDFIKRLGHKLRGSGRSYGLAEISRYGDEIENAGTHENVAQASALADALCHYATTVEVRPREG